MGYCPPSSGHQLRGRIITPIYDPSDGLVALSTRHLDPDHPNRFWHEVFDKGSYLYGLPQAKYTIQSVNKAIIVEGEFDVIALHMMGFKMTVGVCGSALTLFQIGLLSRYCSEIYLLFDADDAGKEAMRRADVMYKREALEGYGIQFFSVRMPKGMDPDEFVFTNGRDALKERLIESKEKY